MKPNENEKENERAEPITPEPPPRHTPEPHQDEPFHALYAPHFTRKERASLAPLEDPNSLDPEIALLRLLIRRHLARPPSDLVQDGGSILSVDPDKIRRYVDTLSRAIRTHRLAGDSAETELERAMGKALDEVGAELGIKL